MILTIFRILPFYLFVILLGGLIQNASAQPQKWAHIDRTDFLEDGYFSDSSASAVVLFDKGHLRVEDDLQYYLDRHVRIKLIRPEGYKWATVEIDFNKDYDQEIEDLEAASYTFNSKNNRVVEYEVGKDAIFEEKIINDWSRINFTFPSLEPGCIIEYKYTHRIGDPGYIPVWYFDWNIPVVWNELVAEFPAFLRFTKVFSGEEKLDTNEWEEFKKTIWITYQTNDKSYHALAAGGEKKGRITFNGERFTWISKNREGIPRLPYMTTVNDYKSKIRLQLSELNIPDRVQKDYAKKWDDVISYLLEHDDFGEYLKAGREYDKIISSHASEGKPPIDKVRLLFDYVADSYIWDEMNGIFAGHSLKDVITTKKGSGTELNLLLTGLLRQTGIEAYPVLISTRNHGAVSEEYVLPNQFNHVITLVKLEKQDLLLDASKGKRSLYLLPESDLNGRGLIVKKSNSAKEEWATLMPLQKSIRAASFKAKINTDGSLNGRASGVSTRYFAHEGRHQISKEGEQAFINDIFFRHFTNYNSSGHQVAKKSDLDSTLNYSSYVSGAIAGGTEVADNTIYLDAIPIMKWVENPFKQKERKYPVNLPYAYGEQLIILYEIPAGYEVEEHPENMVSRIENEGGMFTRVVTVKDDRIIIRSVIDLGRPDYAASEYKRLKLFFDKIIEAHSEKIVLKKSTES